MLLPNLYARVRFCHVHWHARPRVRRAPGLPCALFSSGGQRNVQTSGERCREIAKACPRHCQRNDAIHVSPCGVDGLLRFRLIAYGKFSLVSCSCQNAVAALAASPHAWCGSRHTRALLNASPLAKEPRCSQTCRKCVWRMDGVHWLSINPCVYQFYRPPPPCAPACFAVSCLW